METKVCTKCDVEKPVGEFGKDNRLTSGRRAACKTCRRAGDQRYYENNREASLAYSRRYYESNREAVLASNRRYRKNNPQTFGLIGALSRSTLSEEELFCGASRTEVRIETAFIYRLCRLISEQTGIEHHIDHIVPISKGGVHREWNLRILPATENYSKNDKFDDEWSNLTDEDIERLDREALEFTPQ